VIRAWLDVNVLVSGFPASRGVPAELIERWLRREFELILSEHILSEGAEAWEQPYWAARYTADQVQNTLIECGQIVESWGKADHLGLLSQIGAIELPASMAIPAA
jgi:predicted nucleic acid-binding protein